MHRSCCHNVGHLILRVGVGAGLLYHGLMKLNASEMMVNFIGGVAHNAGLTFLSVETWFQLVRAIEIGGGALLILGLFTPVAATLGLIVLLFAANSKGWAIQKAELDVAYIITLLSLALMGPGKYSIDAWWHCRKACKDGACTPGMKEDDGCCGGGCCDHENKKPVTAKEVK